MSWGIFAALAAGAIWSLNFIAPRLVEPYSPVDLALVRFIVAAITGFTVLFYRHNALAGISAGDIVMSFLLGAFGYVGYFFAVAIAIRSAGGLLPPLIISLVPIVLGIIGFRYFNPRTRVRIVFPMLLVAAGLLLVNARAVVLSDTSALPPGFVLGLAASFAALGIWIAFALLNERVLAVRKSIDALTWAALISVGSGATMLAFLPAAPIVGMLELANLGLFRAEALPLIAWGVATGVLCSLVATWAWSYASQRVPAALAAQLMMTEVLFAIILGSIIDGEMPAMCSLAGAALLLVGVAATVHAIYDDASFIRMPHPRS
ncbi:DMT family transporter [Bosea sp. (in: a-proteobacteria)]|uniref:DMT family transporter n=1 Tax=Bosea sp. (in: a-proteobacteria) TaxID=1871050 RepID=UPI00263497D8|nr:DMT family transporter [Bosea sp. (in: a-proteobacteria)]MCO5089757.1 DMT family transporter [Bosea sp. (in: a-proteobacteria)]